MPCAHRGSLWGLGVLGRGLQGLGVLGKVLFLSGALGGTGLQFMAWAVGSTAGICPGGGCCLGLLLCPRAARTELTLSQSLLRVRGRSCLWKPQAKANISFQPHRMVTGLTPTRSCWLWVRAAWAGGQGWGSSPSTAGCPTAPELPESPIWAVLLPPELFPSLPCMLPPPQAF